MKLVEASANLFGADGGRLQRTFGKYKYKFFASIAAGQVFGSHTVTESVTDQTERVVPGRMPEGVVIPFKIVDINHHQRQGTLTAAGSANFTIEKFLHVAAVVEASKRVADGQTLKGLAQIKVGNGESDVFGKCVGQKPPAANEFVGLRGRGPLAELAVIPEREHSEGLVVSDERDGD